VGLVRCCDSWCDVVLLYIKKKTVYNSMVKSVLSYGAENLSLYEDDRRRVNATERDVLAFKALRY
jgi:hypothetical protein